MCLEFTEEKNNNKDIHEHYCSQNSRGRASYFNSKERSLIHRMTSPKQVTMIQQEVHDNQRGSLIFFNVPKPKNISTQATVFTAL